MGGDKYIEEAMQIVTAGITNPLKCASFLEPTMRVSVI
jgi:hypothetical protein